MVIVGHDSMFAFGEANGHRRLTENQLVVAGTGSTAAYEVFLGCKPEDGAPRGEKRAQSLKAIAAVLDETSEAIKANGEDAPFLGDEVLVDVDITSVLVPSNTDTDGENSEVVRLMPFAGVWRGCCKQHVVVRHW